MKNLFLFLLLNICTFTYFAQRAMSHEQVSQEAYFDYIEKGYPASQWPQYQSKYVEEYKKRTFNSSYGGSEYQRKTTNVAGLITNSAGQTIGRYSNGQLLNSYNQPIGYINGGTFMSQQGIYSNCVGSIQGNRIMNCQGGIYYTINGTSISNSQGYIVAYIRGESIYNSSNQLIVTIAGISNQSIAAYLLFLSR